MDGRRAARRPHALVALNGFFVAAEFSLVAVRKTRVEELVNHLTGWVLEDDRKKSSAAGFDFHLVKPVSLDALNRLLAEVKAEDRFI